jgi:hypothetical protein
MLKRMMRLYKRWGATPMQRRYLYERLLQSRRFKELDARIL